jgi:hypothetical protein
MKKQISRGNRSQRSARVNSKHALVGTWEQEPNPGGTTSVVYTIFVKQGRFLIKGNDDEDGTLLKISRIRWDGESLRFATVFPPSRHKANHVLKAASKGKMSHYVSCIYSDGKVFSDEEFWRKRRNKKKMK